MQKTVLLAFLFLLNLSAQHLSGQSKIYGEVFFREKPLRGVQVTVEGKDQRTETDINGVFILNGMNGRYKLRFIYQDFNKVSDDIDAAKGNITINLHINAQRLNIHYSEIPPEELSKGESDLMQLKIDLKAKNDAFKKSSSEINVLDGQKKTREKELGDLQKKLKDKQFGITENDVKFKAGEVEGFRKQVEEKQKEVSKNEEIYRSAQQKVTQKEQSVEAIRKQFRKSQELQEVKFEVANSLVAEKEFYSRLSYLPLTMPESRQVKRITAPELWPMTYSKRPIITFDSIAHWMNKCITDKSESGMDVNVSFYRCDYGLAVVIIPHVVDEQGRFLHNNLEKKYAGPGGWSNMLLGWSDTKTSYVRSLVFIFSDKSPYLTDVPQINFSEIPAEQALENARFYTDKTTLLEMPARNSSCTVIAYMYKFFKGEPDIVEPFNEISIETHLGKNNTNLGSHLMKFYPDTDCYH